MHIDLIKYFCYEYNDINKTYVHIFTIKGKKIKYSNF